MLSASVYFNFTYLTRFSKQQQNLQPQISHPQAGTSEIKMEVDVKTGLCDVLESTLPGGSGNQKDEKSKFGFPQSNNYNVADYRSLVKTLVCGVKTITWGCAACKVRLLIIKHVEDSF